MKLKFLVVIFIIFLDTFGNFSYAGNNEISNYLQGASINSGGEIILADPYYYEVQGWGNYSLKRSLFVKLYYDFEAITNMPSDINIDVTFSLLKYNINTDAYDIISTGNRLSLDVTTNTTDPKKCVDLKLFNFSDPNILEDVKVKITDVAVLPGGGSITNDNIYLEASIKTEFTKDISIVTLDPSWFKFKYDQQTQLLSWSNITGAEEYELEWVYIDENINNSNSASSKFDLKEPVTIRTSADTFKLQIPYPNGKIYARIRGISKFISSTSNDYVYGEGDVESYTQWSNTITIDCSNLGNFEDKNWTLLTNFAEEGKNKSIITYFDGSGRNRQTITELSTDETSIVAESKYDYEGRSAVNILPAPTKTQNFLYRTSFNKYNGNVFDKNTFDGSSQTYQLDNSTGTSAYFSSNNEFNTDLDKIKNNTDYIPNANGYVYTQNEYSRDKTGHITKQTLVGEAYKKGNGHEREFYYATPTQTELQIMFGQDVGIASHYKKNLIKDENGQIFAYYYDQNNKLIAKVLIRSAENLLPLKSSDESYTVSLNGNNIMSPDGTESKSTNLIFNETVNKNYSLKYRVDYNNYYTIDLTIPPSTIPNQTLIFNFRYELSFQVLNPNGIPIDDNNLSFIYNNNDPTISFDQSTRTFLISPTTQNQTNSTIDVTLNFLAAPIGTYTIIKSLKLLTDLSPSDFDNIISQLSNQGTPYEALVDTYQANQQIDSSLCSSCFCDHCRDHILYENQQEIANFNMYGDTGKCPIDLSDTTYSDILDSLVNECMEANGCNEDYTNDSLDACDAIRQQMLLDVSPNNPFSVSGMGFEYESPYLLSGGGIDANTFWGRVNTMLNNGEIQISITNNNGIPIGFLSDEARLAYLSNPVNWNENWASELIKAHREYCQYQKCEASRLTEIFEIKMKSVNTWSQAIETGYINPFDVNINYSFTMPNSSTCSLPLLPVTSISCNDDFPALPISGFCSDTLFTDPWLCYEINDPNGQGTDISILQNRMINYDNGTNLWEYVDNFDFSQGSGQTYTPEQLDTMKWNLFTGLYYSLIIQRIDELFSCTYYYDNNAIVNDNSINDPNNMNLQATIDTNQFIINQLSCYQVVINWQNELYNECNFTWQNETDSLTVCNYLMNYCNLMCHRANPNQYILNEDLTATNPLTPEQEALQNAENYLVAKGYTSTLACISVNGSDMYVYNNNTQPYDYDFVNEGYRDLFAFLNNDIVANYNPANPQTVNYQGTCADYNSRDFMATGNYFYVNNQSQQTSDIFCGLVADTGSGEMLIPINTISRIWYPEYNITNIPSYTPSTLVYKNVRLLMELKSGNVFYAYIYGQDDGISFYTTIQQSCPVAIGPTNLDSLQIDPQQEEQVCLQLLQDINEYNFDNFVDNLNQNILTQVVQQTVNANPNWNEDFYYTLPFPSTYIELYYYDRVGNLVQSVPPKGVELLPLSAFDQSGQLVSNQYPDHIMTSNYDYNAHNLPIQQTTPDKITTTGLVNSNFFYNLKGLLSKKIESTKTSNFFYDAQDRLIETYKNDINNVSTITTVSKTFYDLPAFNVLFANGQKNIKGRVAAILSNTFLNNSTNAYVTTKDYASGAFYSYDIQGNVKEYVTDDVNGIGKKHMEYEYDLISGKVNRLDYQTGALDQFFHKYRYDADNRLTNVYTSTDNILWYQDAKYYYYPHGPLARVEIGDHKVQGMDYAYTLQGWLKGVNSNTLMPDRDIGSDALPVPNNLHSRIATDEIGFTLGYYQNILDLSATNIPDYQSVSGNSGFEATTSTTFTNTQFYNLFNGNITYMATAIKSFSNGTDPYFATTYKYDQLNRLRKSHTVKINQNSNIWEEIERTNFAVKITYDKNGNIDTLMRNDNTGLMDNLYYSYGATNNRLITVDDNMSQTAIATDFEGTENYSYDDFGRLTDINQTSTSTSTSINWTPDDKVYKVSKNDGTELIFKYDPMGNRIEKTVQNSTNTTTTYYVRDAQGNILANYHKKETNPNDIYLNSLYIYGSKRLGMLNIHKIMDISSLDDYNPVYMANYSNPDLEKPSCRVDIKFKQANDSKFYLKINNVPLNQKSVQWTTDMMEGANTLVNNINNTNSKPNFTATIDSVVGDSIVILKIIANEFTDTLNGMKLTATDNSGLVVVLHPIGGGVSVPIIEKYDGMRQYELTNHLGNVLATVSDYKYPVANTGGGNTIEHFEPVVVSAQDYYPFGMLMPGRTYSPDKYRFGFNGQEKDDEVFNSTGSSYTAQFWQYDSRIGRRWNLDPKPETSISQYATFANNPIFNVDPLGDKIDPSNLKKDDKKTYDATKSDLQTLTGLTIIENDDGTWDYAKNEKGKAIVDKSKTYSKVAQRKLKRAINKRKTVSLLAGEINKREGNNIFLSGTQTQTLIDNYTGNDKMTIGFGMIALHEINHWMTGKLDPDNDPTYSGKRRYEFPGTNVNDMNRIRKQMGYNLRLSYSLQFGNYRYIPFNKVTKSSLIKGIILENGLYTKIKVQEKADPNDRIDYSKIK